MTDLDTLLDRNADYARSHEPLGLMPRMTTLVISCLDARVDPAHILGLRPGDSLVLRNAGGRVTGAVEQEIALLAAMVKKVAPDARLALVLIHHTDCGMEKLARPEAAAGVAAAAGLEPERVAALAIHDHGDSLREDVARLKASALVPAGLSVTALRWDHRTGAADLVARDET